MEVDFLQFRKEWFRVQTGWSGEALAKRQLDKVIIITNSLVNCSLCINFLNFTTDEITVG